MRRLLFIPIPTVALVVSLFVSAVGHGHAQSPAQDLAQGTTITQSLTAIGPGEAVSTTGELPFVGMFQEKLADGSMARESYAGTGYAPAANGCTAETVHSTRTFATPADTYDIVGVAVGCPVPGNAAQSKASGNGVITGGTGRYKGAIGTQTWIDTCTFTPPKAGQPLALNCTGQVTATITLAGK